MSNILVSYPHSSIIVPNGIENRLNLSKEDLLVSMDFGTDNFFSGLDVEKLFSEVHLFFGNLNRHISGNHLTNGEQYQEYNGLFVTKTASKGVEVYKQGQELTQEEKQKLLHTHYIPYYQKLTNFILSGKIDFVIDVHSCDPIASGNQLGTSKRADIILGNRGDENGNMKKGKNNITFDTNKINELKLLLEKYGLTVSLNTPFSGGNITQQFGNTIHGNGKIPILQLEVNKALYISADGKTISEYDFNDINKILETTFKKLK